MEISDKEYSVIREISNNHLPDQRTIAKRAGISLGLTNLIIKRLITKGYVKAKQLNKKKIQYLLTPEGFTEKAKKSYNFTLKTISLLESFKERIKALIIQKHNEGVGEFAITGGNKELWTIISMVLENIKELNVKFHKVETAASGNNTLVLSYTKKNSSESIDLVNYLSETGQFF
jgi:DNA-binding MarR family transcriptional regulator